MHLQTVHLNEQLIAKTMLMPTPYLLNSMEKFILFGESVQISCGVFKKYTFYFFQC